MLSITAIFSFISEWKRYFSQFIRSLFKSDQALRLENLALRSQLELYQLEVEKHNLKKPASTPAFRQLWVFLSKTLENWEEVLMIFKPKTVIKWHRTAFKWYWAKKSKRTGRPKLAPETIQLIKRIHEENPLLSPEKLQEKLYQIGIQKPPAPNTIAKYLPHIRKPPSKKQLQSWKTFIQNHHSDIWATDFLTIPTIGFKIMYVLVIIEHRTRKIISFGVTTNPTAEWTVQQFRNATPYGLAPKYLIHDNDPIFRSHAFQRFLKSSEIISKRTSYRSPWQNPYAERVIGIIKRELLDHLIPLNQMHLYRVIHEYVHHYYNPHRTHQGLDGQTPIPSPVYLPSKVAKTKIKATPILNGLYHSYKKVA